MVRRGALIALALACLVASTNSAASLPVVLDGMVEDVSFVGLAAVSAAAATPTAAPVVPTAAPAPRPAPAPRRPDPLRTRGASTASRVGGAGGVSKRGIPAQRRPAKGTDPKRISDRVVIRPVAPPPPSPPPPPPPKPTRPTMCAAMYTGRRTVVSGRRVGAGYYNPCAHRAADAPGCCRRCQENAACQGWFFKQLDCSAFGAPAVSGVCYEIADSVTAYEDVGARGGSLDLPWN